MLLFAFDHFVDTNSELLKPKFTEEDYTNYMWAIGYSGEYKLSKRNSIQIGLAPAINFIEIDTARTNTNLSNAEATDTTLSFLQKFTYNIYYDDGPRKRGIGFSILHYWTPNPLQSFANDTLKKNTLEGTSTAFYIDFIL